MILKLNINKIKFFIITNILFLPLISIFLTWTIIFYFSSSLYYYPLNFNSNAMNNFYINGTSKNKDRILLIGLDGILQKSLNINNTPNLFFHKSSYWKSFNYYKIPETWSSFNVKAVLRGGSISWKNPEYSRYIYNKNSFFKDIIEKKNNYKLSSIQLDYPKHILNINGNYITKDTLKKINSKDLKWIYNKKDTSIFYNLFSNIVESINNNNELVFGFSTLSDEIAHRGWTLSTKKYNYSLWIENEYIKFLQELLDKRKKEYNENWLFILFTDHGRDNFFDGQHHNIDKNSLQSWFYTNKSQDIIEKWINKPLNSDQRGLIDINLIIKKFFKIL